MRLGLLFSVVFALSCGGTQSPASPPARVACDTSAVLTTSEEVVAAGACTVFTGNLTIRGADIKTLAPLAKLQRVTGNLVIAGAFALDAISGLDGLQEVGGDFTVVGNPIATGVFFPKLAKVVGKVSVRSNDAALTVSLHKLVSVGGDLVVTGNDSLLRLDLSILGQVGGALSVKDNAKLETFAATPAIRQRAQTKIPQ